MKKILVAHPARQHSYRLAGALYGEGLLDCYVTTVYNKPGSLTSALMGVLSSRIRRKAADRRMDDVPDDVVLQRCELEGLAKLFCMHVPAAKRWYTAVKYDTADRFARKVARLAIEREVDAVITYDDTSPLLFEILERDAPWIIRITDMSAANLLYMRGIYEHDFALKPLFKEHLYAERVNVFDPVLADRARREIEATQYFLCGSEFVVKSLVASGVSRENTRICHYGVDVSKFMPPEKKDYEREGPLRFCFVGGTKEFKGLAYMLDAFERVDSFDATLTVIGTDTLSDELRTRYMGVAEFTGMMPHTEVAEVIRNMDVMIFPSLGEGFGLAIIEGLASGLPVIATQNTGSIDIMTDGLDGFIIPIQDQRAIEEKIRWFMSNRDKIPAMAVAARKTAECCSWELYSRCVVEAIKEICGE